MALTNVHAYRRGFLEQPCLQDSHEVPAEVFYGMLEILGIAGNFECLHSREFEHLYDGEGMDEGGARGASMRNANIADPP